MVYKSKKLSEDLYLKLKGISLREASDKVGLSIATLSRIQNEGMPSLLAYGKVCRYLGVSLDTYVKKS